MAFQGVQLLAGRCPQQEGLLIRLRFTMLREGTKIGHTVQDEFNENQTVDDAECHKIYHVTYDIISLQLLMLETSF